MMEPGIIVSIQPHKKSSIDSASYIVSVAKECERYAIALRIEGAKNITAVKKSVKIPVIGLIKKPSDDGELITPTANDGALCIEAGADYIAVECTVRTDNSRITKLIDSGFSIVADISTLEDALEAQSLGVHYITTALSGYVGCKKNTFEKPDIKLVKLLRTYCELPVIAEGRYWTDSQIKEVANAGAYAICIGTAITDPQTITKRANLIFNDKWKELEKRDFQDP